MNGKQTLNVYTYSKSLPFFPIPSNPERPRFHRPFHAIHPKEWERETIIPDLVLRDLPNAKCAFAVISCLQRKKIQSPSR